jgi:hypothetical protein
MAAGRPHTRYPQTAWPRRAEVVAPIITGIVHTANGRAKNRVYTIPHGVFPG